MTEVPKIVHDRLRAALDRKRARPRKLIPMRTCSRHLPSRRFRRVSATASSNIWRVVETAAKCSLWRFRPRTLWPLRLPLRLTANRATGPRAGAPAPHKLNFAWPALAWPTLRWAALAAGVAVAAAVLLVHPGKLNQVALPSANRAAVPAPSGPQIATSPAVSPPIATPSTDQLAVLAKTEEPQPKPELRASKKLKAGQVAMPPHPAEYGMLLADNKKDSSQADKASAAPSAGARAFNYEASAGRGANETVEVSGGAVGVETESSAVDADGAKRGASDCKSEASTAGDRRKWAAESRGALCSRDSDVTSQECNVNVSRETDVLCKPDSGAQCHLGNYGGCPATVAGQRPELARSFARGSSIAVLRESRPGCMGGRPGGYALPLR